MSSHTLKAFHCGLQVIVFEYSYHNYNIFFKYDKFFKVLLSIHGKEIKSISPFRYKHNIIDRIQNDVTSFHFEYVTVRTRS